MSFLRLCIRRVLPVSTTTEEQCLYESHVKCADGQESRDVSQRQQHHRYMSFRTWQFSGDTVELDVTMAAMAFAERYAVGHRS